MDADALQSLQGAVDSLTLDDGYGNKGGRRRSRVSEEGDENVPPTQDDPQQENGDDGDEDDGEEEHAGGEEGAAAAAEKPQRRQRQGNEKTKDGSSSNRRRPILANGAGGEVVTRLLLPAGRIGGVIGRGGEVIKSIRETTAARITIASSGTDVRDPAYRLVSISGPMASVCSAVDMIACQATLYEQGGRRRQQAAAQGEDAPASPPQQQHEAGLKIVIDAAAAGQLIGKRGATIQEIRSQSGARIQVISEEESVEEGAVAEERIVVITGDASACRRAHHLISAVLSADPGSTVHALHASLLGSTAALGDATFRHQQQSAYPMSNNHHPHHHPASSSFGFPAGGRMSSPPNVAGGGGEDDGLEDCQVIMRIPNEKIGRVIGKEGSTINRIRQEAQCRIDIENTRSGEHALRVIRIRGNMQQTQVAQELIRQRMTAV